MHCNPQWSMRRVWKLLRTILQESALNSRQSELLLGAPALTEAPVAFLEDMQWDPEKKSGAPGS